MYFYYIDPPYHIDPPSPHVIPHSPTATRITNLTPAPKMKKPAAALVEEVPHQWTTSEARTLIQIRLSDSIDRRFRTTKKEHKHIWLAVSKQLKSKGIDVDHVQAQSKYNKLRREYTKRYQKVNKSGADRTPLFEWEFYEDLEPSFRSCSQIEPDHVESSELPETTSEDSPSGETSENSQPSQSQSTPIQTSLLFPNRRKKRPLTQDSIVLTAYKI